MTGCRFLTFLGGAALAAILVGGPAQARVLKFRKEQVSNILP